MSQFNSLRLSAGSGGNFFSPADLPDFRRYLKIIFLLRPSVRSAGKPLFSPADRAEFRR